MSELAKEQTEEIEEAVIETPTHEDIARKGGWRPKDEWEGDESEWRSAEVFNERGDWIKKHKAQETRIDELESSFNQRLEASNKLHKIQLETQKNELIRKRDDAIDLADRSLANGYQNELDALNVAPAPSSQEASVEAWNARNPWIYQAGPKSAYAQSQLNHYLQNGNSIDTALSAVDADLAREFPAVNPGRDLQPTPEGGTKPGGKRQARSLTMADLTSEEQSIYKNMPGTWSSEAEFLKAVSDSRSES